jgi:hypothetical protein
MADGPGLRREMLSKTEPGQRHLTLNAKMTLINMDIYLEHDGPVDLTGGSYQSAPRALGKARGAVA